VDLTLLYQMNTEQGTITVCDPIMGLALECILPYVTAINESKMNDKIHLCNNLYHKVMYVCF